jgi:Ca-activated chloride channel homolog
MKKLVFLFLMATVSLYGQTDKVKGDLSSIDSAELSILNIYPEEFPQVSVVFKAAKKNGDPVWDLTKEKMQVKENGRNCEVLSIEQISKNKPINIGVVIDHSGSMMNDGNGFLDKNGRSTLSFNANGEIVFPKGYVSPLDNAKSAVKTFVSTFNTKKDFISIIGFSDSVDVRLPLTQDLAEINATVDKMVADFSTALYDATIVALDQIKNADGIKVLVVLTDGTDNASKAKMIDIINKAKQENIPIYMIGLGQVNKDTLAQIAEATNGKFYFTKSASSLNGIYAEISKEVQAFYGLVYRSDNFSLADTTRQIELSFDIANIFLTTNPATLNLSEEVIAFISKKEQEKTYYLYGGIGLAVLLVAGTVLFYYKKQQPQKAVPIIKNLYPNPTDGNINLDYESTGGDLQIMTITGQIVKSINLISKAAQFNLTDLQDGVYLAVILADGQQSNAVKFIIQR